TGPAFRLLLFAVYLGWLHLSLPTPPLCGPELREGIGGREKVSLHVGLEVPANDLLGPGPDWHNAAVAVVFSLVPSWTVKPYGPNHFDVDCAHRAHFARSHPRFQLQPHHVANVGRITARVCSTIARGTGRTG